MLNRMELTSKSKAISISDKMILINHINSLESYVPCRECVEFNVIKKDYCSKYNVIVDVGLQVYGCGNGEYIPF